MPKFLHTFCCCVIRPTTKTYKQSDSEDGNGTGVNPSSIITQVTKCGNSPTPLQPNSDKSSHTAKSRLRHFGKPSNKNHHNTNVKNNAKSGTPVTEGQTTVANATSGTNSAVTVTSPMPTEQFVLSDTPAAIADFKEKEKYKESLLPVPHSLDQHKKCLIVDLDETLVHSSFRPVKNADFIIPVEIDNVVHQVYVLKRPYADEFLERIGMLFECVLFTASLAKYADPVADLLDKRGTFRSRLFREACVFFGGNYVKDLDRLGRDLEKVVIIDNSPASYAFHPENAVPVRTWFDDPHDRELLDMIPLLEDIAESSDIYQILSEFSMGTREYGMSQVPRLPYGSVATSTTTTTIYGNAQDPQNNNYLKQNNNNNNNNDDSNTGNDTTTVITSSASVPNSLPIVYNYTHLSSSSTFNAHDNSNRSSHSARRNMPISNISRNHNDGLSTTTNSDNIPNNNNRRIIPVGGNNNVSNNNNNINISATNKNADSQKR